MAQHLSTDSLLSNQSAGMAPSKIAIIGAVAFFLQTFLSSNIAIYGICPNFFLIATLAVTAASSVRGATIAGFAYGLLFDLLGAGPVGGMALMLTILGFAVASLSNLIKADSFVTWLIILVAGALAVNFFYCIVLSLTGYETAFFAAIVYKMLPCVLYDSIIGAVCWLLVKRFVLPSKKGIMESRVSL